MIPGLGRSPGEGKGHPLQHSGPSVASVDFLSDVLLNIIFQFIIFFKLVILDGGRYLFVEEIFAFPKVTKIFSYIFLCKLYGYEFYV